MRQLLFEDQPPHSLIKAFVFFTDKMVYITSVTAKLISAFVFATRIVRSLFYLNPKFQASSHLLWLYSPVCVRPGRKPRKLVFSQRVSFQDLLSLCTSHLYPRPPWGRGLRGNSRAKVLYILTTQLAKSKISGVKLVSVPEHACINLYGLQNHKDRV